jgi:hypothetical protein
MRVGVLIGFPLPVMNIHHKKKSLVLAHSFGGFSLWSGKPIAFMHLMGKGHIVQTGDGAKSFTSWLGHEKRGTD